MNRSYNNKNSNDLSKKNYTSSIRICLIAFSFFGLLQIFSTCIAYQLSSLDNSRARNLLVNRPSINGKINEFITSFVSLGLLQISPSFFGYQLLAFDRLLFFLSKKRVSELSVRKYKLSDRFNIKVNPSRPHTHPPPPTWQSPPFLPPPASFYSSSRLSNSYLWGTYGRHVFYLCSINLSYIDNIMNNIRLKPAVFIFLNNKRNHWNYFLNFISNQCKPKIQNLNYSMSFSFRCLFFNIINRVMRLVTKIKPTISTWYLFFIALRFVLSVRLRRLVIMIKPMSYSLLVEHSNNYPDISYSLFIQLMRSKLLIHLAIFLQYSSYTFAMLSYTLLDEYSNLYPDSSNALLNRVLRLKLMVYSAILLQYWMMENFYRDYLYSSYTFTRESRIYNIPLRIVTQVQYSSLNFTMYFVIFPQCCNMESFPYTTQMLTIQKLNSVRLNIYAL